MGLPRWITRMIPAELRNRNRIAHAYGKLPKAVVKKSKEGILSYRNKFAGKRCFLIGNGPSLTAEDLEKLKGEYTFAANMIYRIFDRTDWRPTFYCVVDEMVAKDVVEKFPAMAKTTECLFPKVGIYDLVKESAPEIEKLYFVPMYSSATGVTFSERIEKGVCQYGSVLYMALQIAVYMGFTEIYLLGVDHSYPYARNRAGTEYTVVDKNLAAHFYETKAENREEDPNTLIYRAINLDVVTEAFEYAERYSRAKGTFRVYNATRGGALEVFERVDLDEVLKTDEKNKLSVR